MIISSEQARAAAQHLAQQTCSETDCKSVLVEPDVFQQAIVAAVSAPDLRQDRVEEAKRRLCDSAPESADIAEKMICRIVSDAVR